MLRRRPLLALPALLLTTLPLALTLALQAGCSKGKPPSSRGCAVDPKAEPITGAQSAGCLIVVDGGLLVTRRAGTGDKAGRVNPPGGDLEAGETARCAAVRQTFEETGLRVRAGALFGGFRNDFLLFQCRLVDPADLAKARTPSVPPGILAESSEKLILDLPAMTNRRTGAKERWAFASNVVVRLHYKDIAGIKSVQAAK